MDECRGKQAELVGEKESRGRSSCRRWLRLILCIYMHMSQFQSVYSSEGLAADILDFRLSIATRIGMVVPQQSASYKLRQGGHEREGKRLPSCDILRVSQQYFLSWLRLTLCRETVIKRCFF